MKHGILLGPMLPTPPARRGVIPLFFMVCAALGLGVMVLLNQALGVDTAQLLGWR